MGLAACPSALPVRAPDIVPLASDMLPALPSPSRGAAAASHLLGIFKGLDWWARQGSNL